MLHISAPNFLRLVYLILAFILSGFHMGDLFAQPGQVDPRITPLTSPPPNLGERMRNPCRGPCPQTNQEAPTSTPSHESTQDVGCYQFWVHPPYNPKRKDKLFCGSNSAAACNAERDKYVNETECEFVGRISGGNTQSISTASGTCYVLQSHGGPGSPGANWSTYCGPGAKDSCWSAAQTKNDEWKGMPGAHRYGCSKR